jgi:hypothetical protein
MSNPKQFTLTLGYDKAEELADALDEAVHLMREVQHKMPPGSLDQQIHTRWMETLRVLSMELSLFLIPAQKEERKKSNAKRR